MDRETVRGSWRGIGRSLWNQLKKSKVFIAIICIEVLLLLAGAAGLFRTPESICVQPGQEGIALKAGLYQVTIDYSASQMENTLTISDVQGDYGSILFGTVNLYEGNNIEKCRLWVLRDSSTLRVDAKADEMGEFQVNELRITTTNAGSRIWLFAVGLLALGVNGIFFFRAYDRIYGVDKKNKLIYGLLILTFIIISIPSFVDYNIWGDDWGFHLLRVEGLLSGLEDGQFPVRIQGNWLKGYGYAVSIFYSDLFLLIPALLRLLGFTIRTSNILFTLTVNAAAVIVAYQCFYRCFRDKLAGMMGTVTYVTATYRIFNVYLRAALGETLAMVFLPLVFYGFYRIFTGKEDKRGWLVLTIGLTGVIQSHVITCEMLAFTVLIVCIILIKKVLCKEVFVQLVKCVVMTLLVNAWYLIPFLDYYLTVRMNVGNADAMSIKVVQDWGIYPTHLLSFFYGSGKNAGVLRFGMYQAGAYTVGAALLGVYLLWAYLELRGIRNTEFRLKGLGRLAFGLTSLFFLLSLNLFPWNALQNLGGLVEQLVLTIQFPYRFLSLACLSASVLTCVIAVYIQEYAQKHVRKHVQEHVQKHAQEHIQEYAQEYIQQQEDSRIWSRDRVSSRMSVRIFTLVIVGTALLFACYQTNMMLVGRVGIRAYDKQAIGTMYLSGAEYLPYMTDYESLRAQQVTVGEGVAVTSFAKGQGTLETRISVHSTGADSFVELPLLYYKGYAAVSQEDGGLLAVENGSNNLLRIRIPAGYEGTIRVFFQGFWYWRAAEVTSLIALVILLALFRKNRKTAVQAGLQTEGLHGKS